MGSTDYRAVLTRAVSGTSKVLSQIVGIVLSVVGMVWMIAEFEMQIKVHMRLDFGWQEVMLIQIFLCLSCNCLLIQSASASWFGPM